MKTRSVVAQIAIAAETNGAIEALTQAGALAIANLTRWCSETVVVKQRCARAYAALATIGGGLRRQRTTRHNHRWRLARQLNTREVCELGVCAHLAAETGA